MPEPTTPTPPPRMICRSCHRPLDAITFPDEPDVHYVHAVIPERTYGLCRQLDPMPVGDDVGDTIGVCDFCSTPEPRWNYPCADFELPTPDASSLGAMSQGAWGACDECHDEIETGHWNDLANRALAKWPFGMRSLIRPSILDMHRSFAVHRAGPAVELWKEDA